METTNFSNPVVNSLRKGNQRWPPAGLGQIAMAHCPGGPSDHENYFH